MRLCVLVRDWLRESELYIKMESPLDHFLNPRLFHEYWDGDGSNYVSIGWVDEECQEVRLITGYVKAADPEFFNKLRWAINKANWFCRQLLDEQRKDRTRRPMITAQDVMDHLGEPKYL